MLHYASAALLVVAGGWLGMALAASEARRVRALDDMLDAARWLQTHVLVECMVLPQALKRVSVEANGLIGAVCADAARALTRGETPDAAWPGDKPAALMTLTPRDWALWRDLVVPLGDLPYDAEQGHIEACVQRLTMARADADRDCRRNAKLWRTLGIVGGAAAALLLL